MSKARTLLDNFHTLRQTHITALEMMAQECTVDELKVTTKDAMQGFPTGFDVALQKVVQDELPILMIKASEMLSKKVEQARIEAQEECNKTLAKENGNV